PFFGRFGLSRGSAKCRILEGQALKALNRVDESISVLEDVRAGISVTDDDLLAFATVPLIELYMRRNDLVKAGERFAEADELLRRVNRPLLSAEMLGFAGELARQEGRFEDAIVWLTASVARYDRINMPGYAARVRLVLAETLLAFNREDEALTVITAAIPIMQEVGIRPELAAALALLQDISNRRTVRSRRPTAPLTVWEA